MDNCFPFENGSPAKTVHLLNISGMAFSSRAVFCCRFALSIINLNGNMYETMLLCI